MAYFTITGTSSISSLGTYTYTITPETGCTPYGVEAQGLRDIYDLTFDYTTNTATLDFKSLPEEDGDIILNVVGLDQNDNVIVGSPFTIHFVIGDIFLKNELSVPQYEYQSFPAVYVYTDSNVGEYPTVTFTTSGTSEALNLINSTSRQTFIGSSASCMAGKRGSYIKFNLKSNGTHNDQIIWVTVNASWKGITKVWTVPMLIWTSREGGYTPLGGVWTPRTAPSQTYPSVTEFIPLTIGPDDTSFFYYNPSYQQQPMQYVSHTGNLSVSSWDNEGAYLIGNVSKNTSGSDKTSTFTVSPQGSASTYTFSVTQKGVGLAAPTSNELPYTSGTIQPNAYGISGATWSITNGSLPEWMTLNTSTGVITYTSNRTRANRCSGRFELTATVNGETYSQEQEFIQTPGVWGNLKAYPSSMSDLSPCAATYPVYYSAKKTSSTIPIVTSGRTTSNWITMDIGRMSLTQNSSGSKRYGSGVYRIIDGASGEVGSIAVVQDFEGAKFNDNTYSAGWKENPITLPFTLGAIAEGSSVSASISGIACGKVEVSGNNVIVNLPENTTRSARTATVTINSEGACGTSVTSSETITQAAIVRGTTTFSSYNIDASGISVDVTWVPPDTTTTVTEVVHGYAASLHISNVSIQSYPTGYTRSVSFRATWPYANNSIFPLLFDVLIKGSNEYIQIPQYSYFDVDGIGGPLLDYAAKSYRFVITPKYNWTISSIYFEDDDNVLVSSNITSDGDSKIVEFTTAEQVNTKSFSLNIYLRKGPNTTKTIEQTFRQGGKYAFNAAPSNVVLDRHTNSATFKVWKHTNCPDFYINEINPGVIGTYAGNDPFNLINSYTVNKLNNAESEITVSVNPVQAFAGANLFVHPDETYPAVQEIRIFKEEDAYLNIEPLSKTVSPASGSVTFNLDALNLYNITANAEGDMVTSQNFDSATNTLTVNYSANSTRVERTATITASGETLSGEVINAEPATLTQEANLSSLTVSPKTNEVGASAGVLNINILPEYMNLNSITYRVDSGNVTITSVLFNSDKTRAQFYYAANTSAVAEKSGTVTIYGTDLYGLPVSDSFSITQRKAQPTITVTPASSTVASNESPAVFTINHTGNLEFDYTVTGNLSIDSVTYTDVDATTTRFNVYLDANLGNTQKQGTFQITTDYYGSTVSSNQFTLTQKGMAGTVVVTPETKEVNGVAGSTTFVVWASNMDTLAASVDSSTISGLTATLNQERTQLTVVYGTNTGSTDLSATIRVSGNDINGDTQYDTVQLTQHPKGTITINPSTTEVGFTAGTATMALVLNNIDTSSVSVSSSSAWVTTNYDANTRQITITYTDNTDNVRTATIIVNANDIWGASISSTATLTQMEVSEITINCSPISRTLTATEQMCQFYVNATPGITLNYSYTGNLDVDTTRTEIDVDRQTGEGYFKVYTNDNETSQLKTGVFVVTATYGGTTYRSNEMTVYKQGVGGSIILTPSSVEIPAWSGSMDIDVNHTNIDVDDMSAIIVSSTINNLSATLNADKTKLTIAWDGSTNTSEQSARISVRGTDYWGYNKYTVLEVTQVGVTPYIRLIPDVIDVPAKAGSVVLNVEYWGVDGTYYCNDVGTMSGSITVDRTNNTIRYTYNANTRRTPRRGELLTIDTITSTQESISTVGIINQAPGVIDSIKPVWNPDQINIMTENSFMEYHIDIADNIVYAGKIYKQPDSDVISFNIGDVASNYLHNGLAFSDGLNLIPDYVKDFKIVTNEATEYNQTIYNSWAYEDTDYWLSEPIDYRISCKQWLPVSFISTNYREINVNNQAYYANRINKGWTVMQNLRNYNVGNDILVYGADGTTRSYKIADGDYVLYYANAFGGWDSLLCNATSKKTDNIESLNYRKKPYSRDEFSKIDYQKNITPTWTMNTGIIKSGDKMHHLLESTMVYLHKLETNEIIPVVITNSTCDYLNYTNNGKRPCTYQITVEESNQKIRK